MFGRTEAPAQTPRVSQLEARVVLLELPRIPKLTVTTVSVVRHDVALEQAAAALSSAYVELPDHVAHVGANKGENESAHGELHALLVCVDTNVPI